MSIQLPKHNRQWLLKSRPQGMVSIDNFSFMESQMPSPNLARGELLARNLVFSFDPAQRPWLDDMPSYLPPVDIGAPVRATAIAQVIQSDNPKFPVGALIQGLFGWQEYLVVDSANPLLAPNLIPPDIAPEIALSVFGASAITAYFGLLDIGKPRPEETVVVSSAAGATGSMAAQIAKIKGCRVIGIAGGPKKCAWLLDECKLDHVVDYKSQKVSQSLKELCPKGIDIYFDNVGGKILEAALTYIAERGRVVLCGHIAHYNDSNPQPGPMNLANLIIRRGRMEGFIVMDYFDRVQEAYADIGKWLSQERIAYQIDMQEGFENIPATLLRLFNGENNGKQLLKLADPE